MSQTPTFSEGTRPPSRQEQILLAARTCFTRHGFHGASISMICKATGMSPGHIYHYFENKEAIIAAIVEEDLNLLLGLTARLRQAPDPRKALEEDIAQGVRDNLDPEKAALKLEIAAEAARNPRIAEIVEKADQTCQNHLAELLTWLNPHTSPAQARVQATLIASLFEGLHARAIRNPQVEPTTLIPLFQEVIVRVIMSR
jgi:AcrR family transcriptional regulator